MAEWTTIKLSSLENFKDFSAEYYKNDYLQKANKIRKIGTERTGKIARSEEAHV